MSKGHHGRRVRNYQLRLRPTVQANRQWQALLAVAADLTAAQRAVHMAAQGLRALELPLIPKHCGNNKLAKYGSIKLDRVKRKNFPKCGAGAMYGKLLERLWTTKLELVGVETGALNAWWVTVRKSSLKESRAPWQTMQLFTSFVSSMIRRPWDRCLRVINAFPP
jgi:hypothetical protein